MGQMFTEFKEMACICAKKCHLTHPPLIYPLHPNNCCIIFVICISFARFYLVFYVVNGATYALRRI